PRPRALQPVRVTAARAPRSNPVTAIALARPKVAALLALCAGLAVASPAFAQNRDPVKTRDGAPPAAQPAGDEQPANPRMHLRSLTLSRSGVGYFERRATIEGQEKVQLRFATEQINDILKSMVILDLGGGQIDGVSYGSKEPLQRRLASFGIDLS